MQYLNSSLEKKQIKKYNFVLFFKKIIKIFNGVELKNYRNCTRKNWQNIIIQAARKENGNKDINGIIKNGSYNNEFNSKQ